MHAGAELFATYGFTETTTEMIARQAGVNKALINYHYRSKEGLYREIVESTLLPLREQLEELRAMKLPPDEHLQRFIRVFSELHRTYPTLSTMILRELLTGGERVSELIVPHFTFMMKYVAEILNEGVLEKTFRPVDPFLTHLSLISSLVFFFATAKARDHLIKKGIPVKPPDTEEYIRHVQELFLRGLKLEPNDLTSQRS